MRKPLSFEDFASALGFSPLELEANRAGHLSDRQRANIQQQIAAAVVRAQLSRGALHAICVALACWMAIGVGIAVIRWSLDLIPSVVVCGFLIPILLASAPKSVATPPAVPALQCVVGPIAYQERSVGESDVELDLRVAGWVFANVPPVFVSGVTYRIFFVVLDLRATADPVMYHYMRFPVLQSAELA